MQAFVLPLNELTSLLPIFIMESTAVDMCVDYSTTTPPPHQHQQQTVYSFSPAYHAKKSAPGLSHGFAKPSSRFSSFAVSVFAPAAAVCAGRSVASSMAISYPIGASERTRPQRVSFPHLTKCQIYQDRLRTAAAKCRVNQDRLRTAAAKRMLSKET